MTRETTTSTLCFPDGLKSCFACCPPIRPAGYEHVLHRNIIRRMLRENTATFLKEDRNRVSIRGFSCWALGYLDRDYRLPGCLLHPSLNDGVDLRYRVNYGGKCQRETCPEAKTFSLLPPPIKAFWSHLADGLDSFSYSSRSINLLFRMMNWGSPLLQWISVAEGQKRFTGESFLRAYPFFTTSLPPRGHAYLLRRLIVDDRSLHRLKSIPFKHAFERFSSDLVVQVMIQRPQTILGAQALRNEEDRAPSYVHHLQLDRDFGDFLRLTLRVTQATLEDALAIKHEVDTRIQMFRDEGPPPASPIA